MTVEKTLSMKVLEGRKIPYEVVVFPDTMRDAAEIAVLLGIPPSQVYKTLVVMPAAAGQKPMLVMVAANRSLDLKKLAAAVGAKKLKMATHREAEEMTGLQVGGISALALLNRGFQVYIDRAAAELGHVYVSAGKRGINLCVPTKDLAKTVNARLVDVSAAAGEGEA